MKYLTVFLYMLAAFTAQAQYHPVTIPGSEVRKIQSSIVPGQEYELHILLPAGYQAANKKYPVVYLMDGQWDFPLVKCLYGEHYFDGFIPELIVVGVTWGGDHPNYDSLRVRDYTPTKEERRPQSGGAERFLAFMKQELFPFIESNYKADNQNRTLMGCSLGGLFTLYTLFTQPELFSGYAAASPAVGYDKEVLHKYEAQFAKKRLTAPVRVYMTVGDVERSSPVFEKFAALMAGRKYPSVQLRSKVLENTGHSGTKSETYGRGLQYVFERPRLRLAAQVLNDYAGTYQLPDGQAIQLKNENGQLALYASNARVATLYASSEKDFYATSEFLNLHFRNAHGKTEGFLADTYGNSQFAKKTN